MSDKRVCFDFEVDFSNGGGIQGQGFRLDITGDDISDQDLAAHIIKDLRLLMVGELRILNKEIIEEAHKRSHENEGDDALDQSNDGQTLIDLSHVITDGMITYKGLPAPLICDHLSFADSHAVYDQGTEFQIGRIEMVSNTGTYLDAPYHRYRDGDDLETLALHKLSDLPGCLVRLRGHQGRAIDWPSFAAAEVAGRAVLVETGWSDHWGSDAYFEGHPFLTAAAAEYLRDQGAALVGIDSLNIDDTSGGTRPVHSILLGAGIPIVEHLTNLAALPASDFRFWAIPPKVRGMGTFPVRAHARVAPAAST
ncbi:MAG: cyclase family protein [Pseudomonadota bacterium]